MKNDGFDITAILGTWVFCASFWGFWFFLGCHVKMGFIKYPVCILSGFAFFALTFLFLGIIIYPIFKNPKPKINLN